MKPARSDRSYAMPSSLVPLFLTLAFVLFFCRGSLPVHGASTPPAVPPSPLGFERNEGQWIEPVRFVVRGRDGSAVLTDDRITFLPTSESEEAVVMQFAGSGSSRVEGSGVVARTSNYFIGRDPSRWRSDVAVFSRVVYRELYPSIDLHFHDGNASGELEYDFVVRPEGDPRRIRLRFDVPPSLMRNGDLQVGRVVMKAPLIYQETPQGRSLVRGRYRLLRSGEIAFSVGRYDRSLPLIIDPVVVGYSSFLGGTGGEFVTAIAVDTNRNVYVTGATASIDFPTLASTPQPRRGFDLFLVKLDPTGSRMLFSTFLGGSGDETAASLALDGRGDIYVAAQTSSPDLPTTDGAPQRAFGGGPRDLFVSKLGNDGAQLLFSTYLGGEADEQAGRIAVDVNRDVFVTGWTLSGQFPTTPGGFQTSRPGPRAGFVSKLRTDPPSVVFSTYLGGSDEDFARGIAVDAASSVYVIGRTLSTDFPVTAGAFQTNHAGSGSGAQRFGDGFVAKLAPAGDSLIWSTLLGGTAGETGNAVVVDSSGGVIATGLTFSTDFPVTAGVVQPQHAGGQADVYVARLTPEGDQLVFSTFLGGRLGFGNEEAFALALDRRGNIHLVGSTSSADFPTTEDALSRTLRGGVIDAFVTILPPDGSKLVYSTFLGGSAPSGAPQENGWAIAVDHGGNTYVGGQTRSADFPTTPGAFQTTYRGNDDGFITKFVAEPQDLEGSIRLVPVVGSTAGAGGSFFRTSVQLHNPLEQTIGGRLVFHPQGVPGSDSDPAIEYLLAPRETIAFSDLLPAMGQQGIGSADLITRPGEAPESVIRIFNDAGARGTTGMSQEPLAPEELLIEGMSAVLIAPIDPVSSRFNIGVRTAASGAMLTVTQRDRSGAVLHGITRSYAPNYFEQLTAAAFLGRDIAADDSISIRVDAGSVVVYGATTDNLTQDPSLQLARPVDSVAGERRVLPVVGSTPGAFGSFFKTAVQLHNATQQAIEGRLVFHPAGIRGGDHDPALPYRLAPGETISYDDLLPAMGLSGLGSVDLVSTTGPLPLSVTRIYNDAGDAGTTGMTEEQVPLAAALRGGDRGVLLAPANPDGARFNIGIRTLDEGVTITFVVRNSIGREVGRTTRELAPVFFTQLPASTLLGLTPRENDSITVIVESGAAIVYGTYTDNITQDPTLKVARRRP